MEPVDVLAIGIDLDLVPTQAGGRSTPLLGGCARENRFTYRPNWGLPGWPDGDQTAGPVLGFSRANVQPGEQVRGILVPLFLDHAPDWRSVSPGDVLRMYEGSRICGRGHVRWVKPATWPMPEDEQDSLAEWLAQPDDASGSSSAMRRTADPEEAMAWLADLASEGSITGYDAERWSASTWVLHAMHENRSLDGLGTHDDIHRRRLDAGDVAPLIIGDVNLDEATTVTGTPLGFVVNPGSPWVRVTWADYLARFPDFAGTSEYPPCHRWFPKGSWPVSVSAPPEGSLDQESLRALLGVLAAHSEEGDETRCYAFYASLPAGGDFDSLHLWEGPLRCVEDLISENGGPYDFSPTNLWPVDRSWFVWTDYDLQGTKVSGEPALVDALKSDRVLECVDWQAETTDQELA